MIRVFRHYIPSWIVVLCLVEAGLLFIAAYVGATWRVGEFNPSDKLMVGALWPRAVFWSVTMLLLLTGVGLYQPDLRDDLRGIWFRLTVAFLVGVVLITLVLSIAPSWSLGPGGLSAVVSASLLGVGSIRSALHLFADSELSRRRILVLGAGEVAREVEKLRRRADWRGLQLLGFVQLAGEQVSVSTRPVYPHDGELSTICANMRVDELVVAVDEESTPVPVGEVLDCKVRGIQVTDLIGFFEQRTGKIKVDSLKPSQVIFADGFVQAALKSTLHRVFDITVSSMMLVALSWLMLLTALLIRLESKRGESILYRQTRVGRDNQPFEILKFRSMTSDAEKHGAQWARPDDARITRVGSFIRRTRIDELPQLVNVIRGEMSFVGPRPERPEFVEHLSKSIPYYNLRHRVNPGITGWAQICYPYGASEADAKEKLQFDLYYIKNYSLFLDMMILLQTVQVILWGKGAR